MSSISPSTKSALTAESFTSFGALLLYLRRRARLRQRDLALAVGYSEAQIGRLENDQRVPDVATVMAQFIPALDLEQEPELSERLLALAQEARRANEEGLSPAPPITVEVSVQAEPSPGRHELEWPHQLTPLLGREAELARLESLLKTPNHRCLTLLGPGGVGKTRLAYAVAQQNAAQFAHGVCAVPLASVTQIELLVPTIAQALGLTGTRNGDLRLQLQNYLRDKELLLLLDNFEHLVEGSELLAQCLAIAPNLSLLITSRERLQLRGEITLEVMGLPLPPTHETEPEILAANPAIALFCSTAQRVRYDNPISAEEQVVAARICRMVEGLPLAIELAGAWAHLLSFEEIEQELRQNLDFLQTGMRDLPPRHRSLRAAFNHSWELLTAEEQRALGRLSLLRGSFSREAANALLQDNAESRNERLALAQTLQLLAALADKSMLQRSDTGGSSRFMLHEIVRQYAIEHLRSQPTEWQQTGSNHAHFFGDLLLLHDSLLRGPQQVTALTTLAEEADHVRAALQWLIEHNDLSTLHRIIYPLAVWYEWSYAIPEAIATCEQIIKHLTDKAEMLAAKPAYSSLLMIANTYASWFHGAAAHSELSSAYLQSAETLALNSTDQLALGEMWLFSGITATENGDLLNARRKLLAAIQAFEGTTDSWRIARGLYRLALLLHQQGEYVRAQHLLFSSVGRLRTIGDPRALALTLNWLGRVSALLGRYDDAQEFLLESLLHCAATRDQRSTARNLFQMGSIAQQRGEHNSARYFFQESLQISSELQDRSAIAETLALIGYSAVLEEDLNAAREAIAEAAAIVREHELINVALALLVGQAALDLAEQRYERAVEALAFTLDHPMSGQFTRDRAAYVLRQAETELTPYRFVIAQTQGRTATLNDYLAKL